MPVKSTTNVVGLYDLVHGQFYSNAGSGSFTAPTYAYSRPLSAISCNNFYKDGGAAVAEYDLTQKRPPVIASLNFSEGVNSISLTKTDEYGHTDTASYMSTTTSATALGYPYSYTSSAKTGYTMNSGSSGNGVARGDFTISPTASKVTYNITYEMSEGSLGSEAVAGTATYQISNSTQSIAAGTYEVTVETDYTYSINLACSNSNVTLTKTTTTVSGVKS